MDHKRKQRRENFVRIYISPIADEELRKKKEKDHRKACYQTDKMLERIKNDS